MTKPRRAYGTGGIYYDKRRRRWVATVELPVERGRPRRRKYMVGSSRETVETALAEYHTAFPPTDYLGRAAYEDHGRQIATHTVREWWALVRSVGKRCYYCGIVTDAVLSDRTDPRHTEKDHRVPLFRGGSDGIENIVVSCRACNAEKGTMTEAEYLAWRAAR